MEQLQEHAPTAIFAIGMEPVRVELLYAMRQAIHVTPRMIVVLVLAAAEVKYVIGHIQCVFPESVQSVLPEQVKVTPRQTAPILIHANQMVHVKV